MCLFCLLVSCDLFSNREAPVLNIVGRCLLLAAPCLLVLSFITLTQVLEVHESTDSSRLGLEGSSRNAIHSIRRNGQKQMNVTDKELETILPGSAHARLLCLILTTVGHYVKMKAVSDTWAKRCDKFIFVYGNSTRTYFNTSSNSLHLAVPEGTIELTGKVKKMFEIVYQTYNDSFDWILKCDDDTYVIIENLRFLLALADQRKPSYLGYHMKIEKTTEHGYMSGGAGYVINYIALHQMIHRGFQNKGCTMDGVFEDVEIGLCLINSSVSILRSLDVDGREAFHPVRLDEYMVMPHPRWLKPYSWNKAVIEGEGCCSNYSISFHHLHPAELYVFEHLLYKTKIHRDAGPDTGKIFHPVPVSRDKDQF